MNTCNHNKSRFLYYNSIKEIGHACDLMVCLECGATTQECDENIISKTINKGSEK